MRVSSSILFPLFLQPPENDCDYAPPYSSPIASQNRALISDSVRDEDMDFEECEPLTHGGGAEEDGKQPGSEAGVEYGHRHGKAHLHMAASRAVCSSNIDSLFVLFSQFRKSN